MPVKGTWELFLCGCQIVNEKKLEISAQLMSPEESWKGKLQT